MMKCSQCGKEFTADELTEEQGVCPACKEKMNTQENTEQKNKKSKTPLIVTAAVAVAVLAGALFMLHKPQSQTVSAKEHSNPTSLAYITEESVGLVKDGETLDLYINSAADENNREQLAQVFSNSVPYIGDSTYCELENGETVYIPLNCFTLQDMERNLYLKTVDGNEKVLDEDVNIIYAHSSNAVYYTKTVDGKQKQLSYQNGEVTPIEEVFGEENIFVHSVSDDNSLMQVIQLDENQNIAASGYFYNGKVHLPDEKYTMFGIAKTKAEAFLMEPDKETGLVDLYRVKDFDTEELELLCEGVTEAVIYDDGSMVILGDADIEANSSNPVGSVYLYDAQTGITQKMADNAVALVEPSVRESGWMNENGRDITTSELSRAFEWEKPLYQGQVHYIDAQGNFCVSSADENSLVIGEDFYEVDNFTFNSDIYFLTNANDCIYWSRGDELFRYHLGSMEKPDVIPLEEAMQDKEMSAQIGYLTIGNGNIVEESGEKLVLKNFEDETSTTILSNVGQLNLAGLDNDGKNIYFISEDASLYVKSVENKSNPKLIAENVVNAQATSDGLYYMVSVEKQTEDAAITVGESGQTDAQETTGTETQYDLMLLEYGSRKAKLVKEDVDNIQAMYLEP